MSYSFSTIDFPALKKITVGFAVVCCLSALHFAAYAASFTDKFMPGETYYYDDFNPRQKPWKPGRDLNFEEVYKNYQYYEIVLDRDGKEITVNQYIRGAKAGSEKYIKLQDGSLQRK